MALVAQGIRGADLSPGCGCASAGGSPIQPETAAGPEGMVRVPGGSFLMGSDRFYREERPVRRVSVDAFWIDAHPVTNAQFRAFVEATGYITLCERTPDPQLYPDADPTLLVPGSLVFRKPRQRVGLSDSRAWWAYLPGADWRHPRGADSSIRGCEEHPVVHVGYEDAVAYAAWAGKSLPTEREWEFAARGGLEGATYPWGDEFAPDGCLLANVWLGRFPWESLKEGGAQGTTPVKSFPPNGYGLYDVVGNVWEWTVSPFDDVGARAGCCASAAQPNLGARRVVKGGSHLCAPNFCLRYRPAARQGQTMDTSSCHIGFRCIRRPGRDIRHTAREPS